MLLRSTQKFKLLALAIAPLFVAQIAVGAPVKKPVAKRVAVPVKKADPIEVLATHLSLNSLRSGENIAEACRMADFKLLATALSLNGDLLHQAKGEYETTEQYIKRVDKLSNALNGGDVLFCQPLNGNEDLPFVYDADRQRFEGTFGLNQNVWRDVKQLGTYRSKTSMGAAATVKASVEFEYNASLAMPNGDDECGARSYSSTYQFHVPVVVSDAPALKAQGTLAFIGKLVPPYIREDERAGSPTLDNPYDRHENDLIVSIKPARIVLVDGSGKEIWSCTPGFLPPSASPRPKGPPGAWATTNDYPSRALSQEREGTTEYRIVVGIDGKASNCTIITSSGHIDLDQATCSNVIRRARFNAATDETGNPIEASWEGKLNWRIPKE